MISNGSIPRSWREAARHVGTAVTSLRAAVKRGDVPHPSIGPDGKTDWDLAALDALRAARGTAAASPMPSARTSSTSAASNAAPSGTIPGWLLRAAGGGEDDAADTEGDEEDEAERPAGPVGPPLGSQPWSPIAAWPSATVIAAHAELEQQLAEARAQLAEAQLAEAQRGLEAARTENTRWGAAWRAERVAAIARAITIEVTAAGAAPDAAAVASQAAAHALDALPDDQLGQDAVALGIARQAGYAASTAWAWQAQAVDGRGREWDERDDLARMRARRRRH